jgi:hypothetical protein
MWNELAQDKTSKQTPIHIKSNLLDPEILGEIYSLAKKRLAFQLVLVSLEIDYNYLHQRKYIENHSSLRAVIILLREEESWFCMGVKLGL